MHFRRFGFKSRLGHVSKETDKQEAEWQKNGSPFEKWTADKQGKTVEQLREDSRKGK